MTQVFDAYARYYDLLYRDKDYSAEAEYVASHIRKQVPQAKRILELGCGTGAHAEQLARMGYTVDGVDLSNAMLARAEARKATLPSELAARLSFCPGDVRTVRKNVTYDAVISLFHVISYQTTNEDLKAAFETAASHLRPGGLFLFDFWYGPAVLIQKPEVRIRRFYDGEIKVTRVAEPALDVNRNMVEVSYTLFIEALATGTVVQVREVHQMRYLFLPELVQYWGGRFEEFSNHAWRSDSPLSAQSWAGFQVLIRV